MSAMERRFLWFYVKDALRFSQEVRRTKKPGKNRIAFLPAEFDRQPCFMPEPMNYKIAIIGYIWNR